MSKDIEYRKCLFISKHWQSHICLNNWNLIVKSTVYVICLADKINKQATVSKPYDKWLISKYCAIYNIFIRPKTNWDLEISFSHLLKLLLFSHWSPVRLLQPDGLQPHCTPGFQFSAVFESLFKFTSTEWWGYLTISSFVTPLLFWLQSFPASGSFPIR